MSLAITYRRSGDPAEILEVTKIGEPPSPGPGQLQVQVSAFPIHPGDLMAISAMQTPGREVIAGIEATGVVTEVGAGVTGFSPGTRVAFFPHQGAWRQVVNVDAAIAVPVPDVGAGRGSRPNVVQPHHRADVAPRLRSNTSVSDSRGVVLNNAAASSVGRLFTAIAEHHQIATISIVRSEQRAQQLRDRFPAVPVVSTSDRAGSNRCARQRPAPIPVALDPVGVATAGDLLSALSPGGTLIITATLTQEPDSVTRRHGPALATRPYAG